MERGGGGEQETAAEGTLMTAVLLWDPVKLSLWLSASVDH